MSYRIIELDLNKLMGTDYFHCFHMKCLAYGFHIVN